MSPFLFYLTHIAVLSYALVGGVFLAFSDFIMRALSVTPGRGGAQAMQAINREVFRWVFMTLFLGLAALSLLLIVLAVLTPASPASVLIGAAGAIYLFGSFGVTAVFNVPMNEALARLDLSDDAALSYWTDTYLPRWTLWNTVRTIACTVSALLALIALSTFSEVPAL